MTTYNPTASSQPLFLEPGAVTEESQGRELTWQLAASVNGGFGSVTTSTGVFLDSEPAQGHWDALTRISDYASRVFDGISRVASEFDAAEARDASGAEVPYELRIHTRIMSDVLPVALMWCRPCDLHRAAILDPSSGALLGELPYRFEGMLGRGWALVELVERRDAGESEADEVVHRMCRRWTESVDGYDLATAAARVARVLVAARRAGIFTTATWNDAQTNIVTLLDQLTVDRPARLLAYHIGPDAFLRLARGALRLPLP